MGSNNARKKPYGFLLITGILSIGLYVMIFVYQDTITTYFTKASWYDWEEFVNKSGMTQKEKIKLVKVILGVEKLKLEAQKKRKTQQTQLGLINSSAMDDQKKVELIRAVLVGNQDTKEELSTLEPKGFRFFGAIKYAILPILLAFIISFVHGAFSSYFWTVLGIEAKQKR